MKNPSNSAAISHPALSDLPALHAAVCEAVKQALALKVFVMVPLTVFVGLRLRDNVIVALPE